MNIIGNILVSEVNDSVISLDQAFFPIPWSRDQWLGTNPEHHLLFEWQLGGTSIGFALFGRAQGEETAHLYKILMHPEMQGQGQALLFWSEIVKELKAEFRVVYLEVGASNLRAISFYRKQGFKELRRVKKYYSSGEDAVFMQVTF
jgi:ribosomal-protein-alanine N-acetyltransferase